MFYACSKMFFIKVKKHGRDGVGKGDGFGEEDGLGREMGLGMEMGWRGIRVGREMIR